MDKAVEAARQAAIRELIAVRAYELWEAQGRPHGRHEINWRQAEQEILGCVGNFQAAGMDASEPLRTDADNQTRRLTAAMGR